MSGHTALEDNCVLQCSNNPYNVTIPRGFTCLSLLPVHSILNDTMIHRGSAAMLYDKNTLSISSSSCFSKLYFQSLVKFKKLSTLKYKIDFKK